MGAEPGHEKLCSNCQHLSLLRTLPARMLQGLQWQTVSERGCCTHYTVARNNKGGLSDCIHTTMFCSSVIPSSCHINNESMTVAQIALRKRVVVPKETNLVNKTVTQGEQDRSKEAGVVRRDKRITIRVSFWHCSIVSFTFNLRCLPAAISTG